VAHFSVITERIGEGYEATVTLAVIDNTHWFVAVAVTQPSTLTTPLQPSGSCNFSVWVFNLVIYMIKLSCTVPLNFRRE
jgi:hypothetical protein